MSGKVSALHAAQGLLVFLIAEVKLACMALLVHWSS
jgi:hypothetical protein